jgi:hypothetical protein
MFYTGNTLYNIKRKKQKTVCAELAFPKVTFDRMVMHFFYYFLRLQDHVDTPLTSVTMHLNVRK